MAIDEDDQCSFTPAGTSQTARARGDSPVWLSLSQKYSRAERIKGLCLTQRQLDTGVWPESDIALYPCYK
jgi:hypothetical protein